jgi:23S rRNA (adenine2503-C2)-methyltransferase
LHNEAAVVRACQILGDTLGAGFPRRHLVVSTAGVGPRLRPLWELDVAALALSLHSTDDAVRNELVPLNRLCNVAELRRIFLDIPWRPHETLTVAYVLLEGVNDAESDARGLAEWVRGLPVKVNLLEFNPFPGTQYRRASPERMQLFRNWLRDLNVFNTVRRSRGRDAMAACGQLATSG